ncbi:single-stranded DNA-binding protein [Brachyspira hyodysenteriae]|uniref:single-stranded DNA-binding protein n=1 Tax=Brachyspira hyodysenteriae TaxID=159 RepID=UPI0022CD3288|nr:single-stranded DNA-binding protein [Brachyspira hyodysenteriae]MCZ9920430.1 single-stranded DNA-binding protein [Brachyspira hyodysenteriae]MDA0024043.1 single-stranded DNA-binding protein [Brachyspira hyodysenteriae]
MTDHNGVTLIGRLTADPQRKYSQGGKEISEFSIANNYYISTKNTTEVNYFDIVAFDKLAETANKYLTKGKQVCISGTLRQERWQDKNTNTTRSKVRIIMQSMQMLSDKKESNNTAQNNSQEDDEEVPF